MGRTVRDTNLETRSARLRLQARRKPYWRLLETGLHLGYRRTKEGGGSWIARRFIGKGDSEAKGSAYVETKLGTADDFGEADGIVLRSFKQAQEAARLWHIAEVRRHLGHAPDNGPYTVAMALEAYFAYREKHNPKSLAKDRAAARTRILPVLGKIELSKLTEKKVEDWHADMAAARKPVRAGSKAKQPKPLGIETDDPEAVRARQATANRTLTVLKAALNYALGKKNAANDDAWRRVKPFRETDAPIVQFLSDEETRRLVNACDGAFRDLVRAALLTGCRYGELTRMHASDFNADAKTITVQVAKSGKPRHVALTDEGSWLFSEMTAGKTGRELIFIRDDGNPWGASHQQRPLDAASKRAKIDPAPTFHILRHSYASALAMRGVPMGVIAAQLGHSDTRMTEKHYAHLSPNYVAETVRAALPVLGIVQPSNVMPLTAARRAGV